MTRRSPLLTLTLAAATLATAAPASADQAIAVDIIATHDVVWEYVDGAFPEDCAHWSKGSGTQRFRLHSDRRELMRLETAFGNPVLTGKRPGTFEASLNRAGRWRVHQPPPQPPCVPCGPSSEYGECPEPTDPPPPLRFECGERTPKGAIATISYAQSGGLPSIHKGLTVKAWARKDDLFKTCPPDLPRGLDGPSFEQEWPEWERLPAADLERLERLQVGDSVIAEIHRERSVVEQDGRTVRGDRCVKMPDVTDGYGECAITEYQVTFTRMS